MTETNEINERTPGAKAQEFSYIENTIDTPQGEVFTLREHVPDRFKFDQYGVNKKYNTRRQEDDHLRLQKALLEEYTRYFMDLEMELRIVKEKMKAHDKDFKERGFDVATAKRGLKAYIKNLEKTQDELDDEAIVMEWLESDTLLNTKIARIAEIKQESKDQWVRGEEQRNENRVAFWKRHNDEAVAIEKELGLGWLDFERERIAKLVHLGLTDELPKLQELDEQIRIRDERRAQGLPPLPEHDEPAYPDEWLARRAVEAEKEREEEAQRNLDLVDFVPPNTEEELHSMSEEELERFDRYAKLKQSRGHDVHNFYTGLVRDEKARREEIARQQERQQRRDAAKAEYEAKLASGEIKPMTPEEREKIKEQKRLEKEQRKAKAIAKEQKTLAQITDEQQGKAPNELEFGQPGTNVDDLLEGLINGDF